MKKYLSLTLLLFIFTSLHAQKIQDSYSLQWRKVYLYELDDLPKSAAGLVDSIYLRAKKEKNSSQLIKSLIYQSKFMLILQEDAKLAVVNRFRDEISKSSFPEKNILENILANIFWQYYNQHRWQIYNRTRTNEKIDQVDFRTWDPQTLFVEIHYHFQNSLLQEKDLQKTNLKQFTDLLLETEGSKKLRPTLFDLLAHNALEFYQSYETGIIQPSFKFEIDNPQYFTHFSVLELEAKDSLSLSYQALKIYQKLLHFHANDPDPSALVTVDLARLEFVRKNASLPAKEQLYLSALLELQEKFQDDPVSASVIVKIATFYHNQAGTYQPSVQEEHRYKNREALKLCREAIGRFPESEGAKNCRVLHERIEQVGLDITAEKYVPIGLPSRLLVEYKNLDSLEFKVFSTSAREEENFYKLPSDSARRAFIMDLPLEKQWSSRLRNEEDFQFHSTEILVPALGPGHFLILASSPDQNPVYGYSFVQVSNIALIQNTSGSMHRFQVVDRNTGKPMEGARVRIDNLGRDNYNKTYDKSFVSDQNGSFMIIPNDYYNGLKATVSYQKDQAVFGDFYLYKSSPQKVESREVVIVRPFLFTDRSIYRPGQTVFIKGILIKKQGEESTIVSNEYVEVILEDVNGQEIQILDLKTNEFGSFSGEFVLPANGLTGQYTIYVDEGLEDSKLYDEIIDDFEYGEHTILVEEYKRPKFMTEFKPVKESYRLNDTIRVHGTAIAFAGSNITNAKVIYRVQRKVQYPRWYYRYHAYGANGSAPMEITHGETTTDAEGGFHIDFKAIPDMQVSKESLPVFIYEISADVTDINGETHSTTTLVKVGYHTLLASIQAAGKIDKNIRKHKISLLTQNLNGEFLAAKGSLKVYKLQGPANVLRKRPWSAPDYQNFTKAEFSTLFPHVPYQYEDDPTKREKGNMVWEAQFDTEQAKEIVFAIEDHWEQGSYVIELESRDPFGQKVVDELDFTLFSSKDKKPADNLLFSIQTDKTTYKPGDKVKLLLGSASEHLVVTLYLENRDRMRTRFMVVPLHKEVRELEFPLSGKDVGGFAIHYSFAAYNSFENGHIMVPVIDVEDEIAIETLSFRDKLLPGAPQTWSFKITGPKGDKLAVEMLASMYDASLDQFKKHSWRFMPIEQRRFYASNQSNGNYSFRNTTFNIRNIAPYRYFPTQQQYDQLDWFGFSFNRNNYVYRQYLKRIASIINPPTPATASSINSKKDQSLEKGYIFGSVRDVSGEELPGVSVVVKGSKRGTVTDLGGTYTVKAQKGDTLIYSFVGYYTLHAAVAEQNVMDVLLAPDIKQLEEVVVVGYATQEQKSVTDALSSVVVEEDLELEMDLEGRVPGVEISGEPGASQRVKVRGNSSLNGSGKALYVIDGVPVDEFDLSREEILAMEILNGDAATAIYGARAANGVVIISTKDGQQQLDAALSQVKTRENLQETAFFYPHLSTDKKGVVSFNFNAPEALTRWNIQLLAHTKTLGTATKTLQAVTQQELMVMPNPPRFLREGDEIVFSTKISNLSAEAQSGFVGLQLFDALTGQPVDENFENKVKNQSFKINAKGNTQVSWKWKIPGSIQALQYRIVAQAGDFSDGEQNVLPVLPNRMLLSETLPIWARANQSKNFSLEKLKGQNSPTLQHHTLTLEMTSNPVWYAVQALPYLMEYPYECAEQTFARYYANALASYMLNANPRLKEVIDQWASNGALTSNLEKNDELKSLIIQETPWQREAQSESEQQKRLALLFDLNKMKDESNASLARLQDMQIAGGGFPWFKGSRFPNRYISQHIATGFAQLKHLTVPEDEKGSSFLKKAIQYLDTEIVADYHRLLENGRHLNEKAASKKEGKKLENEYLGQNHLGPIQIQYLYMASFYPQREVPQEVQTAIDYYQKQSAKYWHGQTLLMKGMIALVQQRKGNRSVSLAIVRSLREHSINSEEMGMYWKENKAGWLWHQSPIETQALLIETFSEINDPELSAEAQKRIIDEMKVWLLKHKQTKQWPTTKATTQAVYALLLQGSDWVSRGDLAEISVGKHAIHSASLGDKGVEAGTGYFKTAWKGPEITPDMGEVKVVTKGNEMVWGGLYWQYFEDLDKITPAATPLVLQKKLFVKRNTASGDEITAIDATSILKVGDLLRVRIVLKVDREMDFVHLKDMRAAGLEPINVLSQYKWQDGLGYYECTRDASTNFFFEHLPKGVHVFEYDLRVNNRGDFSNGISSIQCMYAPEFSSHSEGIRVVVKSEKKACTGCFE